MTDRPSILLVIFDSLSAGDLEHHISALPVLRALRSESLSFANAYTCCPESSPARASLFTGRDIAVHGLWTDGVSLPEREKPMALDFVTQGYQSWLVGRRHLAGVSKWTTEHARPGEYHCFEWAHGPLHRARQNAYLVWLQHTAPAQYAAIFPTQANPDDTATPQEQRHAMAALPDALSFNAWVGQRTCAHMDKTPFFGIAGFVVGQTMGASEAPVEALDAKALSQADAALGDILKTLPQDTVVVVSASRGSMRDVTAPALHEAAIKVPLMIRAPAVEKRWVSEAVSTMDIAPTLYALAGLRAPQRMQGSSLTTSQPRGWALSRLRHPKLTHTTALIHGTRKLVMTHGTSEEAQLFDLQEDPQETQNLAESVAHQDDLEAMIDLMIDARVALEDRTEPRIAKF